VGVVRETGRYFCSCWLGKGWGQCLTCGEGKRWMFNSYSQQFWHKLPSALKGRGGEGRGWPIQSEVRIITGLSINRSFRSALVCTQELSCAPHLIAIINGQQ